MALNSSPKAIELRDVTVTFGEETILKNVSLEIYEGENFVIVGPSGQGKTVLLKLMAGLITPTSGSVLVREKIGRLYLRERNKNFFINLECFFKKMPCLTQ